MSPVVRLESHEGLMRLAIDLGAEAAGLQQGASVSVAGVCLTAVTIEQGIVVFDVMQETLHKTTLGTLAQGNRVNTERSMRMGDEIGGHRVSGHITGTAEITHIETPPNNHILTFHVDPTWINAILPKGFIALDGCSLTVVDVGPDWFTVHLIPETRARTTFGTAHIGDRVNLELDAETQAVVATVQRYLARTQ